MEKNAVCRIEINVLIRYGEQVGFDVYLRLSDNKIVKISHKDEDFKETIIKYRNKGVTAVYVNKEEYILYLQALKNKLSARLFDPATQIDQSMELLNDAYVATRESFDKMGVNETNIAIAEEISKKGLQVIQSSANIFKFFMDFKKKCDEQFMKKLLVSYMSTLMISNFEWQTASIKEKAAMAALLCDIILTPEDFAELELKKGKPEGLSEKVRFHPLNIAKMLNDKSNLVSNETILIIEQHHERPDGTGFPRKLRHNSIVLLSAIHIVADHFVDLLLKNNFDYQQREELILDTYQNFNQGNFRKVVSVLAQIFDLQIA